MQRRNLLKLGLASAVVLGAAGGAAVLIEPGMRAGKLTSTGRVIFTAVGKAVLDGSLPSEPAAAQQALDGMLERVDALTGALPPHAQAELSQLLALLGTAPGRISLAGLRRNWLDADIAETQAALQAMRTSRLALRQQAYQALHDIVGGAYFSDASVWPMLGYPGPLKI